MTARLKFILVFFLAVGLLLGAAQVVRAAQASASSGSPGIGWWVLSAGGGPASGGQITLNASLGQPVVGQSSSGSTVLNAGYWAAGPVSVNKIHLPVIRK
jgi:hypothetical protein